MSLLVRHDSNNRVSEVLRVEVKQKLGISL